MKTSPCYLGFNSYFNNSVASLGWNSNDISKERLLTERIDKRYTKKKTLKTLREKDRKIT